MGVFLDVSCGIRYIYDLLGERGTPYYVPDRLKLFNE